MENNELYHHGIRGMKWGVRRYQNPDGSLTNAGQKRRSVGQVIKDHKVAKKRKQALEKARAAKVEKAKEAAERQKKLEAGKIPIKKMTNEEIQARITRLQLEKNLNDLVKDKHSVEKGHRFVNKFLDSTIDKVAENSAADVVAQAIKVLTVKGVNSAFKDEVVFTNNKKK